MAVFLSDLGELTITGNSQIVDDMITIDQQGADLRIDLNGQVSAFSAASVTAINVLADIGNDIINVRAVPAGVPLMIDAGDGDDTIWIANLEDIRGEVTVEGGAAEVTGDQLALGDYGAPGDEEYTITDTTIRRHRNDITVHYSGMETVDLQATMSDDQIFVLSTAAGTQMNVNGMAGEDLFWVGDEQTSLDSIQGPIHLYANFAYSQEDVSLLYVNDSAAGAGQTYDISANAITRSGAAVIQYELMEELYVRGTNFDDTFNVLGTQTDTELFLSLRGGANTVNVGNNVDGLDSLRGDLYVSNEYDGLIDDMLNINDQAAGIGQDYTVTTTMIERDGAASIVYSPGWFAPTPIPVTLNATSYDDVVTVLRTRTSNPVTLNLGDGFDTVNVSDLDRLDGALAVNGGGNPVFAGGLGPTGDTLNINDVLADNGYAYSISASAVERANAASIAYSGLEEVEIRGSTYADTFTVIGTQPATPLQVIGNGGVDTLVGPNRAVTWDFNGANFGRFTDGSVAFTNIANFLGGGFNDRFLIYGSNIGWINGGGGSNTLDYSWYTTGVSVNLALGTATDIPGGISNIQNVTGGSGDDKLVGDARRNLLFGLNGNDILLGGDELDSMDGGAGRDLLIGGLGGDRMVGGLGEDLLIGGTTWYDANDAALAAIMAEWTRTDRRYNERVFRLINGGGLNGQVVLNSKTVQDDAAVDALYGSGDLDWFFAAGADSLPDRTAEERVN